MRPQDRTAPRGGFPTAWLAVLLAAGAVGSMVPLRAQETEPEAAVRTSEAGVFVLERSVVLPGGPDAVWAAVTGDLLPWWDHHVSEEPAALYIEPEPGGCFCEIFDATGDGVVHARVTFAKRGETLRYEGPLGLMGNALHMVTTYRLEARSDSTLLTVEVHGAGEVRDGWPEAISRVWRHFLVERLGPYLEGTLDD